MGVTSRSPPKRLGRYALYDAVAAGGMATVYLGRLTGTAGFSRIVAIKRLHPHLAQDRTIMPTLLDEARLTGRIRHPNVVSTLDVEDDNGEVFVVMDYVHGESLSALMSAAAFDGSRAPLGVVAAIMCGALHGLHAAHETTNEMGEALGLVHRDVSPQNILVGLDGITRVLDFGVAKAKNRIQTTKQGTVKGKIAYMATEQLRGDPVDRRADVFAAGVVLWELLTGQRLHKATDEASLLGSVIGLKIAPPSSLVADLPPELDEVTLRATARDPELRYETARQMAVAIEKCVPLASATEVGEWVEQMCGSALAGRAAAIRVIEASTESESEPDTGSNPSLAMPSAPLGVPAAGAAPPSRARSAVFFTAVLGLTVALPLGALAWRSRADGVRAVAPAAADDTPRVVVGTAQPLTPSVEALHMPPAASAASTLSALTSDDSAKSRSTAPTAASAPPLKPRSSSRERSAADDPHASARSTCNPPFLLDGDGVRHYKPQCLK